MRTGSTKSFTYTVLNGKQVTREKAASVKNPRTAAQMRQRMLLTSVCAGYSFLKSIADHSFEGVTTGQQSQAKFNSLNLEALKQYVNIDNAKIAFNEYKDSTINPLPFILAKGSLPVVPYEIEGNHLVVKVDAESADTAEDIYNALGLQSGDLLTFVGVEGTGAVDDNGAYIFTPSKLDVVRLNATKTGAVANPHSAFAVEANHADADLAITFADGQLKITSPDVAFGCVIMSRKSNGSWLRSDAKMIGKVIDEVSTKVAIQFATYPTGESLILNGGSLSFKANASSKVAPTLTLAADSVSITEDGGTADAPTLTGAPVGATITYSSNNSSIAAVNATTGKVTAKGNGTAVITVRSAATDDYLAGSVTFTVKISGQTSSGSTSGSGGADMD